MPTSRITKAKSMVTEIFQTCHTPLSLAELFQFVQPLLPQIAYSTIFRIVARLEKEGKVVRIDWRERGSRYEWADLPHHHHIVCQICGAIGDLADEELNFNEQKIKTATGYLVKYHCIELEGICANCQPH